ncbi:MAG: DUF72 domain-containing protein [Desulfurococcales archaeon]|nr:DUF72 domain-containing protein [Desulfurococcales archaeon]
MRIKVGTCGFSRSRRLVFSKLDVVEMQQTFYDPRVHESLQKIAREAPEGFEFTAKAWMLVTHKYNSKLWRRLKSEVPYSKESFGDMKINEAVCWAWEETVKAASILGATIIVLQTPASFKATDDNVRNVREFLSKCWPKGFQLAWEPRGDWWGKPELLSRINEETGVIIAGDVLRGRTPPEAQGTLYARLHGLGGREVNYRYKYTDDDLRKLYSIIRDLGKKENYILFNNIYSFADALRFKQLVAEA